jgi:hypothetical protein
MKTGWWLPMPQEVAVAAGDRPNAPAGGEAVHNACHTRQLAECVSLRDAVVTPWKLFVMPHQRCGCVRFAGSAYVDTC